MLAIFQNALRDVLGIYAWQDGLEILLLSCIIKRFLTWLSYDTTQRPLLSFYAYCALAAFAYYTHLRVLSTLLLWGAPLFTIILIITHQHTLQKNGLSAKIIKPAYSEHFSWVDELIRASLNVGKQEQVFYYIERHQPLSAYLKAPYTLHADVHSDLIKMVIEYTQEEASFLWISYLGKIIAAQASHSLVPDPLFLNNSAKELPTWQKNALFIATRTDACVIVFFRNTRLFTCIIQGRIVEGLNAAHACALVKRYLSSSSHAPSDTYLPTSSREKAWRTSV